MRGFGSGNMVLAALLLPSLALRVSAASAAPPPALYTARQASAGADVFSQNCALCHGENLEGGAGPALTGQGFAGPGNGATIGGVFTTIAQQMPQTAPASLTPAQYEDVMAYILQKNGYPAGGAGFAYKPGLTSTVPLISANK